MGLGDAAKAALSKAVEALQAIAEVKAIVGQVQLASSNFERRLESRCESLEARIRESSSNFERRLESRCESLEARIRELERENAKLHGQVQAAYAEALKVLFDHHPIKSIK